MKHCDVLVVGGGPAGSTCAWRLARLGLDVIVLDRQRFPRDKVCAGWITPAVVDSLQLDLNHYARGRTLQVITGFRTGTAHAAGVVESRYDRAVSYGIRRVEFDAYLLERARVRRILGEPLGSLQREGRGWVANGTIRAALVVGAGGHFCPVARAIGNQPGKGERAITAQEVEFPLSPEQGRACGVQAELPELYFCEDLKGYAWCFRKGDYLNIGLGREGNHQLADRVQRFVQQLQQDGRIPATIPQRFKGHAYLLYAHTPRRIVDEGVLLVGDAAGLAYAQSGEGIRPAVESGLLAAEVIAAADGDYRKGVLSEYEERLVARFGPRYGAQGRNWLPLSLRHRIARALLRNGWFARNVVMDRWFLHRQQTPLIVNGAAGP